MDYNNILFFACIFLTCFPDHSIHDLKSDDNAGRFAQDCYELEYTELDSLNMSNRAVKLSNKIPFLTNQLRSDGFGAQFQTIIYTAIYAELNNKEFIYSPFERMEHNYDQDPDFLEKKEFLINFKPNFRINIDCPKLNYLSAINFFESNMSLCAKSNMMQKIKKNFRANKNKTDYFVPDSFNIAIHIRRLNSNDNRINGTDIPDQVFLKLIKQLRNAYTARNPIFHIYSQGELHQFKIYESADLVFHLNESIEHTFASLVFADVLAMSPSSFSYTAALLSEGEIYYIPFWHPPMRTWNVLPQAIN